MNRFKSGVTYSFAILIGFILPYYLLINLFDVGVSLVLVAFLHGFIRGE